MNGDVRLTFDPDGRRVLVPLCFSPPPLEDDRKSFYPFDDKEEDEGVFSSFWDSMFGVEWSSSAPSADDLQVVEGGSGGPLVARPSETVVLHSCTSERNW